MANAKSTKKGDDEQGPRPILGGFIPVASVQWGDASNQTAALFPSPIAATWFIRTHREQLVEAQALARHRYRLLIHPERFEAVVQRAALDAAR